VEKSLVADIAGEQVGVVDEVVLLEAEEELAEVVGVEALAAEGLVACLIGELDRVDEVDLEVEELQREDRCPVAHVAVDYVRLN